MLKTLRLSVLALALFVLPVIFSGAAYPAEITVSAAASLNNAFTELKGAFEAKNSGTTVVTNFASSNNLLKQIETGAPVDVFASADQATMNTAEQGGFIDKSTRKNFALNGLVLIAPAGESKSLSKAADLVKPEYARIAVGNPASVPAGRYAQEVLELQNLWTPLKDRLIFGENVRQVLDYVSRGEVQAGFVYSTDAKQAGDQVRVVETMQGKTPVLYPIAALSASKNKAAAQAFVDFANSAEGQAILAKYGFMAP
ncbi:MAG: molybdate ABC transporter substrate-binding protein [Deltaproteobacteria bacterium]|jgi:molybdate transport system substrate-binding protein|nr:molybdate ABC transporter substrate-binding protein [Deltaproteobacteria bacterium]